MTSLMAGWRWYDSRSDCGVDIQNTAGGLEVYVGLIVDERKYVENVNISFCIFRKSLLMTDHFLCVYACVGTCRKPFP